MQAVQGVLFGEDLGYNPPRHADPARSRVLADLRWDSIGRVCGDGIVVSGRDNNLRWWTCAGYRRQCNP